MQNLKGKANAVLIEKFFSNNHLYEQKKKISNKTLHLKERKE